jgi:nucleotide-binding universal stress UspA family protein
MDDYQAGDRLDHFVIEALVFEGALTRVYRARDMLAEATVALKLPFGDILNQPVLYYHLQNEQRIGRQLSHPNIVRYIQRDQSRQYTVMEFIPGQDLKTTMTSCGVLRFEEALPIVRQAANALAYLHAKGIRHLDVKPENIMLAPDGLVKLLDFGLAWWSEGPDLLAEDFLEPFGTPYYIAPEQLNGIRSDPRSDIFSLAMVLYELLTGHLPYQRSLKLSKARQRLHAPPVPPRHFVPSLAPALQEILLRALERRPDDRYPTIGDLMEDLENPAGVPLTARSRDSRKPPAWRGLRPAPDFAEGEGGDPPVVHVPPGPLGLGAVRDEAASDLVLETVIRQAVLTGGRVTLLTVTEPAPDTELTRYGRAVEGEQLRARLDRYVRRLRRFNLDPVIRIRSGKAVAEIVTTAERSGASLLVLGPSRKTGLRRIFGGRTIDKIMRQSPCPVMIAESDVDEPFPVPVAFRSLNAAGVMQVDFFLLDCWVSHINYLSELIFQLLYDQQSADGVFNRPCRLGHWLDMIRHLPGWAPAVTRIDPIHKTFHEVAAALAARARTEGLGAMKTLYIREALPVSCGIREALRDISTLIREQAAASQAGLSAVLGDGDCPLGREGLAPGDPLYKAHQIRDYFCEHPDASPEDCLRHIHSAAIEANGSQGT